MNDKSTAKEERKRLIARLEVESGRMKNEFAILVDRVRASLQDQNISATDLRVLITHSDKNELANLFKKKKKYSRLVLCPEGLLVFL